MVRGTIFQENLSNGNRHTSTAENVFSSPSKVSLTSD